MNTALMDRAALLAENTKRMKESFHWEYSMMYPVCANMYTVQGKVLDGEKIKQCKKIISTKAGVFSSFRGTVQIAFATLLSLEENPEEMFAEVHKVYKELREKFFSSQYLPIAAFIIVKMSEQYDYDRVVARTRRIYDMMKKEHPFLTSSEDATYAVLFALSDLSDEKAVTEMEQGYRQLKSEFSQSNAVQSLSHVLSLMETESMQRKTDKTIELYNRLKEHGCRYGKGYELAILGVLAITTENLNQTVQDIIEVEAYLRQQKGFGCWSLTKRQRLMYAAMVVSNEYMSSVVDQDQVTLNTAVLNSVTGLIIAEQAAMCACIAASSAAAANAASC